VKRVDCRAFRGPVLGRRMHLEGGDSVADKEIAIALVGTYA